MPDPEMAQDETARDTPTRVLVVDDHRSFADALGLVVDMHDDLVCVGRAGTLAAGLQMVVEAQPHVVLMDVGLPDGDGVDGASRVKELRPGAHVMILTAHTDLRLVARAAAAGAAGFFPKESPVEEIIGAIRTVREGGILLAAELRAAVWSQAGRVPGDAHGADPELMTAREREVLTLLGEGLAAKTIAQRLGISVHTTRGY